MPYYFSLPVITDLTIDQQSVLNEPGPIAVSGGPGTGKSVVALWRHIRNHDSGERKSLLLTYTKSLEMYLASSARSINNNAGTNVNRTYYWTVHEASRDYDEIIIDEAQDVTRDKYEIIRRLTPMVSYSADNNQILYPTRSTTEQELRELFNSSSYRLRRNFRNSKQISQFVRSMFPDYIIQPGTHDGQKPQILCTGGDGEIQTNIILEILRSYDSDTHNIAILLPFQKDVQYWFEIIRSYGFACSKYSNSDEEIEDIENIHITTFKSSKGLEFDSVIVPFFNQYEYFISNFDVVEKNDYYVVFTRARTNLFLIDHSSTGKDKDLPFLRLATQSNLIEKDISYISTQSTSTYEDDEDDLPF